LEKITIIGIATAANTEIGIMTATIPIPVFLHVINYVVLYVIRKAIDYGTTPKKNEKSLKLNSGLLTETSLANLMTDLINDSINILWTMRMTILT
jgi:hypothetical protein